MADQEEYQFGREAVERIGRTVRRSEHAADVGAREMAPGRAGGLGAHLAIVEVTSTTVVGSHLFPARLDYWSSGNQAVPISPQVNCYLGFANGYLANQVGVGEAVIAVAAGVHTDGKAKFVAAFPTGVQGGGFGSWTAKWTSGPNVGQGSVYDSGVPGANGDAIADTGTVAVVNQLALRTLAYSMPANHGNLPAGHANLLDVACFGGGAAVDTVVDSISVFDYLTTPSTAVPYIMTGPFLLLFARTADAFGNFRILYLRATAVPGLTGNVGIAPQPGWGTYTVAGITDKMFPLGHMQGALLMWTSTDQLWHLVATTPPGIVPTSGGGTGADLSGTGPGVLVQGSLGAALSVLATLPLTYLPASVKAPAQFALNCLGF